MNEQELLEAARKLCEAAQHLFDMKKGKGSTSVMKNAWNILAINLYHTRESIRKAESTPPATSNELLEALEKIAYPIKHFQEQAEKEGCKLDGRAAIALSNDANWLKGIAIAAIQQNKKQEL